MLTGDELPGGGRALLAGYDIISEQSAVRRLLGYCPQFDALLDLLTTREHLELYARIKGVAVGALQGVVDEKLRDLVGGQAGSIVSFVAGTLRSLIGGGFALFNVLTLLIVTPVVGFYLLRDWPGVVSRIDGWLPRRYAGTLRAQVREVDRILSAWLRGQAICCVLLAAYYAVALSVVGLDLGLIVGMTAGVLSFIPYVGSITGLVAGLGLAMAQFPTWSGVIAVGVVFVVGQLLEGYVIYPRFLGDRVELHAVWVMFALFAGGAAFGFVGVLLAVPVAAIIGVLCRFWLARYLDSSLYLDPPQDTPP
jgi:predicted PurR-regulated permease PerM